MGGDCQKNRILGAWEDILVMAKSSRYDASWELKDDRIVLGWYATRDISDRWVLWYMDDNELENPMYTEYAGIPKNWLLT